MKPKRNWLKMLWNFLRYGKEKGLCIQTVFLSAYYRACILMIKPKVLHKHFGRQGEESPAEETKENYRVAGRIGYAVEQVCDRTPWESKCLVKALCVQHFLKKRGIASTLYLGCGREEGGGMLAHAWVRCGKMFVTGGDGMGYAIVDRYVK